MDNRTRILEVKHLCKYFYQGKVPMKAVDDVNFHVFKGETFGLVGESGCGKTTTGRTIIRLYKPTSGEVWFNGNRIDGKLNKEQSRAVTSKMQMIFQDPVASLNPRMTVEEIISEGAKINGIFQSKEELKANVRKMLELVGLTSEHATRYPHEFSGGQRQRICIARALITKPDLIIADEPISALDVSIQAQVLNLLNDLRKELGLTVLFIAHDLGQFTRNYTQTVKRAADNKRRYAPGWVHSTCLLRGFPKGAAPHLAHDFAEQSVVCYTLCRRCPENTVAAGEGKGI